MSAHSEGESELTILCQLRIVGCGTPLKVGECSAEETDMHILVIAAAVVAIEVLFGCLAGSLLHRCSQPADLAEAEAISTYREGLRRPTSCRSKRR
jgi:hypothetical protein